MIYELKIYEAAGGRHDLMRDRFVQEAAPRLAAHGVEVLAVFEDMAHPPRLLYLTRAASAEVLAEGWSRFAADPGWQAIKAATETDGPVLAHQTGIKMRPVDLVARGAAT